MTSTVKIPRDWATNTLYDTGLDAGTPTRVDPLTNANGFIRGTGAAPQYMNFVLGQLAGAARRNATVALCKPRALSVTLDDTSGIIAVVSQGAGQPVLIGTSHSAGTPIVADCDPILAAGVITSVTNNVRAGAFSPTLGRTVLVGNGGNQSCYSDDGGVTWTAGGALGGAGLGIIWNPVFSRFMAFYSTHARWSTNGAAWTDVGLSGVNQFGVGMLPSGHVVIPTATTPISFSISTDGGTSWGAASGTVPNAGGATSRGWITGAGLVALYHALVRSGDGKLQVAMSLDGASWNTIAEISPPSGGAFATGTALRIEQDVDTGLLFMIVGVTTARGISTIACYASDDGATWTNPILVGTNGGWSNSGFGVANGRAFFSPAGAGLLMGHGRDCWRVTEKPRFEDHIALVHWVIKNRGFNAPAAGSLEPDDLFQLGCMGLWKACQRFDPERGVPFATYACWWIRAYISRGLADQGSTVRVPVYMQERRRRSGSKRRRVLRLDLPLASDDGHAGTGHDVIGNPDPEPAPNLEPLLDVLDPRSRRVISLRLRDVGLREIGEQEGISRERVRQLETLAIATMRKAATRTAHLSRASA